MNGHKLLTPTLMGIVIAFAATRAFAMCGDVTGDGMISATDALAVLQAAVGDYHHHMMCDPYYTTTTTPDAGSTTTTTPGTGSTTTTTLASGGPFTLHVENMGMMSGGSTDSGYGHMVSDPAGIDCDQDCSATFEAGTMVTLTAMADQGSEFMGWWGDVPAECLYNDAPCTVTMTHDRTVGAVFAYGSMMQH